MELSAVEYRKRLQGYSYDTTRLIMECHSLDLEDYCKAQDITSDSELNEEQVVEKLKELLATVRQKKDTQEGVV